MITRGIHDLTTAFTLSVTFVSTCLPSNGKKKSFLEILPLLFCETGP